MKVSGNYKANILSLFITAIAFCTGCSNSAYTPPEDPLFVKLSPKQTGIDFRNDVQDDSVFNEISYRNFYNGGGVAIGDINNDGLPDVFMTANQGKNKLYLNKGSFKFEDITDKAGIGKKQKWSTGVTMADVNGDGLLDIYVCAAGNVAGDNRLNELYINKGNLSFSEEAGKYNLQDAGAFHTQASFFDYDLDGDLDVYLLNNNCLVPVGSYGFGSARSIDNPIDGDKLLRNDDGIFTDVSKEAGIYRSVLGFGLGISVGDINGDHWPDIYISNDFFEKDYLYVNQRNGSFREMSDSCISHMSQSSMGTDMADINNDGWADIFSTDMLPEDDYRLKRNTAFEDYDVLHAKNRVGYHRQLLSNMLHLNNGDQTFSEIAQFAGVDATDWSWGALIFDWNNDGWKDIMVSNGMYLDVTDQDYIAYTADENNRRTFQEKGRVTSYERLKAMVVSTKIPNYAFVNQKNLRFKNQAQELGLGEPGFSNGAAYADLDNDGDLDLVVNNLNEASWVYQNTTQEKDRKSFLRVRLQGEGRNPFGIGVVVTLYANGTKQTLQNFPARGFQSSMEPVLHFGLNKEQAIDSLVVQWPGFKQQTITGIKINSQIILQQSKASGTPIMDPVKAASFFEELTAQVISGSIGHKENDYVDFNVERLMPHMISREGPDIAVGDINGDELEDFFMGSGKHDTGKVFLQTRQGKFMPTVQPALVADNGFEDAGAVFFDVDKDGDLDLVSGSGGNLDVVGSPLLQPRLYLNNGKGIFARDTKRLPAISVNASCVRLFDFDNDGDEDMFIGGRSVPRSYGISPQSYLLRNDQGVFSDVTAALAPGLQKAGMVTDAAVEDMDGDGKKDLILVGEWMPVTIFKNKGGKLEPAALNAQFAKTNGWWNCIKAADLDDDGDLDFVLGNLGLNSKFKASENQPARLYINDFDKNGTQECVLTYYKNDGKAYPYYLRNDLVTQVPELKKRFLKFADYAGKTMEEVFDEKQLAGAQVKEAFQYHTAVLINEGGAKFTLNPLPEMAQLSKIYSIQVLDIDKDGRKDIYLAGNSSGFKPEMGRQDANFGVTYKALGQGGYQYLSPAQSGLFYNGEARDLALIKTADNRETILLTRNNQPLLIFKRAGN